MHLGLLKAVGTQLKDEHRPTEPITNLRLKAPNLNEPTRSLKLRKRNDKAGPYSWSNAGTGRVGKKIQFLYPVSFSCTEDSFYPAL